MSDDKLRNMERDAANDPEAAEKLKRERCRVGQCCACSALAPSIPGPPKEAYGSIIIIEDPQYQPPFQMMQDFGIPTMQGFGAEANMMVRIVGRGIMPAMDWLRSIFETHNVETGIMDTRTLGARLVPAQKETKLIVTIDPETVVDDGSVIPPGQPDAMHQEDDEAYYGSWPYDEDGA